MSGWEALMLIAGGLFAGGAATFAWSRIPIWRQMPIEPFVSDFAQTLSRTDKVQPALLVAAIAGAIGFGVTSDGTSRVFALIGAAAFVAVLAASVAVLVPLQRRLIESADSEAIDEMRQRWFTGHLGRATLSTLAFASVVVAASVA